MSSAFTQYVRALEPGAEPPSTECCEAFWDLLRETLIREMRKRGLWRIPPRCLGIYGRSSWTEEDALEEILVDCYAFVIRRLRGLKAQLERGSNIDGLLLLNVRNFLYETQKRHDPLGFRTFTELQGAMREGIAEKALYVLDGDPRLRNDTVLAFAPEGTARALADASDLAEPVGGWCDDLLPDLILAYGRGLGSVRSRLKTRILDLGRKGGVEAFRFGDVVEPLKRELRGRWNTVWRHSQGEMAVEDAGDRLVDVVRVVPPDAGFEEREGLRRLIGCVDEAIERLPEPRRRRGDLHRLWRCLRSHATDAAGGEAAVGGGDSGPPSRRTLAAFLGISRNRVPDLMATLRRLVAACRRDTAGKNTVRGDRKRRPTVGGEPNR